MEKKSVENKRIKAIDLFSGAGGFSLGFEQSGIEVVLAIEFDDKIARTYEYNNKRTLLINDDIRNIKLESKGENVQIVSKNTKITIKDDIDIIFGGPPCQGFSLSGNRIRKGYKFFEDDRNKLFLDFLRFVDVIKPKIFVIENVPGILNYDNGNVRKDIEKRFSNLGYNVFSKIINSEDYGVPQKRKRAFFIGNNMGLNSENLFPSKHSTEKNIITVWDAISDLSEVEPRRDKPYLLLDKGPNSEYQKLMRDSKRIYNHASSKHKKKTIEILKMIKQGKTIHDLPNKFHTKSVHSGAYGRMLKDEPAYTITTRINTPSVGRITHPLYHRTITPREAARIQSFPDSYKFIGDITSIGIQIGNSVPPLVAKSIGTKLFKIINEHCSLM